MTALRNKISYLWAGAAVLITFSLDQLTKALVVRNIPYHGEIKIIPGFFNLVYIRNRGAAFGFFSGATGDFWPSFFLVLSLVATAFVVFLLVRTIRQGRLMTTSLSLILGGAVGNLVDRIRSGSVVDFIDLHLHRAHWPAFNLADTAITIGGILLLAHLMFSPAGPPKSTNP